METAVSVRFASSALLNELSSEPIMKTPTLRPAEPPPNSLDHALRRVITEIQDGLRHGFFQFTLTCEVVEHERRRLILQAGKSYRFLIQKTDCARAVISTTFDSCNGSDTSAS